MQESVQLNGQRGSVLAGVLMLSVAFSLVAGGFVASVADKANQETAAISNLQVQYAAESGMLMGLRWARTYPFASIHDPNFAANLVLTPGSNGFQDIDGISVKVVFLPGGLGVHTMQSFATTGAHKDTVELTWQMNDPDNSSPINLNLDRWVETFHPGK